MTNNTRQKKHGAVKKVESVWQKSWMTKVLSNGHSPQAKLIFMRIASFGESGCWINNDTFQEEFNRSEDTIRRCITSLWSKRDIIITGWNGHGRKMYASGHPNVKPMINALYIKYKRAGKVNTVEEFNQLMRLRIHLKSKA